MSLFYTDLGRPRGITCPNVLLFTYIALLEKESKWQTGNVNIAILYFVSLISFWSFLI